MASSTKAFRCGDGQPARIPAIMAPQAGDVLLVADLMRLSRSQELAPLLERLRLCGVRVVGVLDGFDSERPQARMQAGLSGLMSEELRASIRVRTHSALQMRANAGRATGGKVYGSDRAGQVIDAEGAIVWEIFERTVAGDPMRVITIDLNTRGIPSPGARWTRRARRHDGRWVISAPDPILQNERCIGRVVWNRSVWVKDPDTGKRVRPAGEWTIAECPALVSADTWAKVQRRAGTCNRRAPRARRAPLPAVGVARMRALRRPLHPDGQGRLALHLQHAHSRRGCRVPGRQVHLSPDSRVSSLSLSIASCSVLKPSNERASGYAVGYAARACRSPRARNRSLRPSRPKPPISKH